MTTTNNSSQTPATGSHTSFDFEVNPFEQSFASKDADKSSVGAQATSPQVLTPSGRKLPPLVLSPGVPSGWGNAQFPRTGLTPNDSNMRTGLTPGGAYHSVNNIVPGVGTPGALGFTAFTPGLSSLLGTNTKEFDQQVQAQNLQPMIPPANNTASNVSSMNQSPKDEKPAKTEKKTKRRGSKKPEEPEPKKKKVKAESDEPVDEEGMTEEEKRKSFLERNRVAASKCRQRKKQQIGKMENDLNFYLNEYNNLTVAVDQLKEQSLRLRQMMAQGKVASDLLPQVDQLMNTINQTNYIARLRGDNPSNIIPTVQPINPTRVQQTQQRLTQLPQEPMPIQMAPPIVLNGKAVGMEHWGSN